MLGYDSRARLATDEAGGKDLSAGREISENINVANIGLPEAAPARIPGTLRTASRDDLLQSLSGIFPSLSGTNIFVPSTNPIGARCNDLTRSGFFSTHADCVTAFQR
jgi:hypothetical protein